MIPVITSRWLRFALSVATTILLSTGLALADGTLRIVTYNIEADISGYTTARPGFTTVIQGIGDEVVVGNAQPIDVLALQETTSNSTTVAPIVTALNTIYGANTYAMSPYQATQNGSASSGNGPNAMVYNTTTLQLIASVGIGTPSSSGAPRQPVRYQFRPAGGSSSLDFYVYVSHYKAGTTSSDRNRRNVEAQMIRTDEATLPASARVLYTGDFNTDSSTEPCFVTLTAAGQGQGFDPINRPGDWALNSAFQDILTESATNLRYRDDFHLVTQNILSDPSGLQYIAGSYHTFGVDGSTAINGTVNSSSNTALPGLPNRSAVLSALTTASDHLPVVADYVIATGEAPVITGQPQSQIVCSGGSATFAVTATGSPAPTYQWRRGTTNLSDGGNVFGATSATLTIDPVGSGDAASNYNCVATNASGSATSNNATLTVNVAPSITVQPQSTVAHTGQTVTFTVTASGTAPLSYQWRKDGGPIGGATGSSYVVGPATLGDAGSYDCVVSNECGATTSYAATLTVWLTGDMNCDGVINNQDIDPFVLALFDPSGYAAQYPNCSILNADFTGDGQVNNQDIDGFVAALFGG